MNTRIMLALVILASAFCFAGPVEIQLTCRDVIVGELKFGASAHFQMILRNSSSEPVHLATSTASTWLYASPWWSVHIEGPTDSRCLKEGGPVVLGQTAVGEFPHIEIKPKTESVLTYGCPGWGNPGAYRVWIEYNGAEVPAQDIYKGKIVSNTCAFNISYPEGVDAEIFNLWRKQNPDLPICEFPLPMDPHILKPEVILEKYPTSTYAGWALVDKGNNYLRPTNSSNIHIENYMKESLNDKYNQSLRTYGKSRIEELQTYLSANPDFPMADWMKFEIAFLSAYRGEYEKAGKVAAQLVQDAPQAKGGIKAKELLTYLKEKKLITEK